MGRRVSPPAAALHALSLLLVVLAAFFGLRRAGQVSFTAGDALDDALVAPASAAPPPPQASAMTAGSAQSVVDLPALPGAPGAAGTPDAPTPAGPGSPMPQEAAIDRAVIGPEGGVPLHASGTRYRSPFARPNAGPPAPIKVGMLLNSVDDYDVRTGTFAADFFLSLTSATPMNSLDLHFPNGKMESTKVIADKPTFKLLRYTGTFKSPPDLRKYPFDSQQLRIAIEDDARGIDQDRLVPDKERTQLARGFRALGWQVAYVEARTLSQSYPDRFEGDDLYYGRYVFSLGIDRFATSAVFKVFVPAFVIVIISLLGMWVPPEHMDVRSNSGAPMLAGAVLFHFGLMQELPATSYMTRADKLMLGVYVSLLLGMISTWWMFLVEGKTMDRIFRIARVVVPPLTVVVMTLACTV